MGMCAVAPPCPRVFSHRHHVSYPQQIGSCEIDFWVKTDQKDKPMTLLWIGDHSTAVATLTITMNENHKQEETSGVTCFYVRDQCSNVFCATTHEDFATGYWRHVHFEIKSLEENQVNLFVDGRPCRMSIKASEGPNVFAGWDQYGMLCAEGHGLYGTQPGQKISKHFYGALIDMRIASFAPDATLRCHWDLLENQEEINPKDVTQTDTPIHHHAVVPESCSLQNGEAIHPDWKLENFPSTCLWFGGHDHINVGPLGAFGELLGVSTRVEFWMRSGCQDRSMSVMRVTDTPMKHAEFGIDLNKNAAGEYQKGSALFTLIDASGTPFVACQSSHDLCDSKWHEVVWEIFQHSRMVVKIDGFTVGLDFHSTELATATPTFIPLTQWLCIGGHNNRGTVQDHFEGFLRNIKISGANPEDPDSGTPMQLACWPLDDGPGCTVSMDKTGNGNNGIIYHRGSKKKWATWLDVPQPDELASLDGLASMAELASFDNNSVELSCVAVTQETNAKGLYQEKVVNLIDGRMEVRLETSCIDIYKKFGAPKPDPSDPFSSGLTGREVPLKVIPAGHGMNISSHENLVQLLSTSIENGKSADHRHSSVLYSLRLGDGQLDVFDLKGFYPRTRSVWDPTTDQWVEPLMLMSQDDKHVMFANQRARQTEEALQRFGRSPALFLNARQSLDGCHFDDTIAGSLLATSFVANPGSGLAFVCLRPRTSTANEDVAAEHFLHAQDDATRRCAAIVLQKAARGWNAKKTRAVRELARDDMLRKREHRRHLRESMPEEVSIRDSRVCLIVNAARSLDPRIPDLPDVQKRCEALVPVLQRQGWTVTVLEGADATPPGVRQALSSLKERVRAKDCVAMVHYMGYAAVGAAFHTWPTAAEIAALLDGNEAVARAAVAHSEEEARLELTAEEQAAKDAAATEEAQRVKHEAAANAEAEKKKRKSKGGGDWVRSTANAQQKEDEEKQRLEAEQSARAPSAEEAALAKAAKTPLPFEPSPTPDVSHIPPTPVYAGADHQYLVLPTTPLEYSPDNTLPLSELQCPELFDPVVGFQCVVSAELHPPPGTDAPAACFLQATSGERASWEGAAAPQFFGHYVFKGLHGGYAAVNVSKLLKSAARVRREAAMVAEHAKTVAAAEEGEDVPPEDLVVPVSERGVSWEAYRDYVHSRMAKRPVRLSGRTFAQGGEQQYVGDIVLAEYLNSFDRRAVSRAASGGVLTVTTDEECVDAKSLLNVRDASMEVVNAVYGGTVRPRPPTPGIHPPQMLLSFDQPVSCALPPYAQEEDWRGYLRSLVAASSAPAADAMRFALRPTTGLTFDLVVSCPDDAAAFDSFVADVALSYRGRMGSLEFRPHALPSDVVMAPTAFKRVSSFPMEGAHKTIQRVKKAYLSGALDMLLQSSGVGASVAGFAPASQAELATMRAAHDEEMRKKKADAAHRAENPTNEMDKLKKSVRDKRRSLASGMF